MEKPIYDAIKKYDKKNVLHFHTPLTTSCLKDELYSSCNFDITELSFSDNLQNPSGIILEAEKLLSKKYNTLSTKIVTSGASASIFIALNIVKELKGKVLITPNAHKSIYSAMQLFNIDFVEMPQKFIANGLPSVITAKEIEEFLKKDKSITSCVITSPTYFGFTIDIKNIKNILDKYNVIGIIDEAHGAHFPYSKLLPKSCADKFDLVIDSVHKTLPVYTGGALLHINNEKFVDKAELYRALLHTTSPNYLTMASIDYARDYFSENGEVIYAKLYEKIQQAKLEIKKFKIIENDDFSRMVIDVSPYSGRYIAEELEKRNVYVEMDYKNFIVLICSPLENDNVLKFINILNNISLKKVDNQTEFKNNLPNSNSKKIDISKCKYEFIEIKDCENRISVLNLGIYPPATVIVQSGQIIDSNLKKYLLENKNRLFGLVSNKICVIV